MLLSMNGCEVRSENAPSPSAERIEQCSCEPKTILPVARREHQNRGESSGVTHRATSGGMIRRIIQAVRRYQVNRVRRIAFRNLLSLDDKMLDDVGVTREEVEWANGLPIRENASLRLYEKAYLRRKSEPR